MFSKEGICKNFYENPRIVKAFGPSKRFFKMVSPFRDKPFYCWTRTSRSNKYFWRVTDRFFWESKKIWD